MTEAGDETLGETMNETLDETMSKPLLHGGRLRQAAARYGRPLGEWLDLSTGISPYTYPIAPLPASVWNRLPEPDDGLEAVARACYGATHLLPVAGSQAAIQALPRLRAPCRVGVPRIGYAEHRAAWAAAGHAVDFYDTFASLDEAQLDAFDVLVVINPNNPTGEQIDRGRLLEWHARRSRHGGWLLVDEAFMDATPSHSLAPESGRPGLIVLRSVGKFYGLAGIRAGFALADPELLIRLEAILGPWALSGPSRAVCRAALADVRWQHRQRRRLNAAGNRLEQLLSRTLGNPGAGTPLFRTLALPQAEALHRRLAEQGILTRLFAAHNLIRFGLPGDGAQWRRLEQSLIEISPLTIQPGELHE